MADDSGAPSLEGLVGDQRFLGLPPAQQRQALYGVTQDDRFQQISDGETLQFVSHIRTGQQINQAVAAVPRPANPILSAQPVPPMSGRTGKAMVPAMGGGYMMMDVPQGDELATEAAAQSGYQKGASLGAGLVAGAGLAPVVGPPVARAVAQTARGAVKAVPTLAKQTAIAAAISQARRIPAVGKYLPSGAELIPYFYHGGGAGEVAKTAATTAAAGEAEALASKALKPEATAMRPPETPAPYRFGPGQIEPESTAAPNPRVLAGNQGVITTPRGLLSAGEAPATPVNADLAEPARSTYVGGPQPLTGEGVLQTKILAGMSKGDLVKLARSRGIDVSQAKELIPAKANPLLIRKLVGDFSEDELSNIRDTWIEATRQGIPHNMGESNWRNLLIKQFFPDVAQSKKSLTTLQKALSVAPRSAGAQ